MARVEAKAHIEIDPDTLIDVIRNRYAKGQITVDNVVDTESGEQLHLKCGEDEFGELLQAFENDNVEKIKEFVVEE